MNNDDNQHVTPGWVTDLENYKGKSRKRLAWELLKRTRNPEFVSVRYGYPVEKLRAAMEKLPPQEEPRREYRSASRRRSESNLAGNLLGEMATGHALDGSESDSQGEPSRVPGEDDE